MKTEFSTLDIVKILSIPRERLREWIDRGFIKPSIQEAEGHGSKALFSLADLYRIEIFKRLVDCGLNRITAGILVYRILTDDLLKSNNIWAGINEQLKTEHSMSIPEEEEYYRTTETGQERLKKIMEEVYHEIEEYKISKGQSKKTAKEIVGGFFKSLKSPSKALSYLMHPTTDIFNDNQITLFINLRDVRAKVDAAINR